MFYAVMNNYRSSLIPRYLHALVDDKLQVFFYSHEYSQFWSAIDGIALDKPIDFKKVDLIPVSYETLLSFECRAVVGCVAHVMSQSLSNLFPPAHASPQFW